MSYLKLAWIPRTEPAITHNPYVHPNVSWEINSLIERAEHLIAMERVHVLFTQSNREHPDQCQYHGANYISYRVNSGDEATKILNWWRKHGFRSDRFKDDTSSGSRDYSMRARDNKELWFNIWMYFSGDECTFVDQLDDDGQRIVDHVTERVPAKEAVMVYKRELICGGSPMPDVDAETELEATE